MVVAFQDKRPLTTGERILGIWAIRVGQIGQYEAAYDYLRRAYQAAQPEVQADLRRLITAHFAAAEAYYLSIRQSEEEAIRDGLVEVIEKRTWRTLHELPDIEDAQRWLREDVESYMRDHFGHVPLEVTMSPLSNMDAEILVKIPGGATYRITVGLEVKK